MGSLKDSRQIGERIRSRRKALAMTQEELGELAGVTYQQVQKYEKGASNLSPERLQRVAAAPSGAPRLFLPGREANPEGGRAGGDGFLQRKHFAPKLRGEGDPQAVSALGHSLKPRPGPVVAPKPSQARGNWRTEVVQNTFCPLTYPLFPAGFCNRVWVMYGRRIRRRC